MNSLGKQDLDKQQNVFSSHGFSCDNGWLAKYIILLLPGLPNN